MKKLALIVASLCLAATPALACPHDEAAPKTAEKAKAPSKDQAKAKPATDKTAKPTPAPAPAKKAEKVSQK